MSYRNCSKFVHIVISVSINLKVDENVVDVSDFMHPVHHSIHLCQKLNGQRGSILLCKRKVIHCELLVMNLCFEDLLW